MINGMTVAAAFNGGGVSSLTYDTNNVEEVSVRRVGRPRREREVGGPCMNIVPRSGGNTFGGQAFFNTARASGRPATTSTRSGCGHRPTRRRTSSTRGTPARRSAGRSRRTGCGSTAATASSRPRSGVGSVQGRQRHTPATLRTGTTWTTRRSARSRRCRAATSGPPVSPAQVTQKNRFTFSHEHQAALRRLDAHDQRRSGCRNARRDWIALGSNDAVRRRKHATHRATSTCRHA